MKFIDERHNNSDLQPSEDNERVQEWLDQIQKCLKPLFQYCMAQLGLHSNHNTYLQTREIWFHLKTSLRLGGIPYYVGYNCKESQTRWSKAKRIVLRLSFTEFTNEHQGKDFFGGEKPNIVDFSVFGYMRSISPFPQFSLLTDH